MACPVRILNRVYEQTSHLLQARFAYTDARLVTPARPREWRRTHRRETPRLPVSPSAAQLHLTQQGPRLSESMRNGRTRARLWHTLQQGGTATPSAPAAGAAASVSAESPAATFTAAFSLRLMMSRGAAGTDGQTGQQPSGALACAATRALSASGSLCDDRSFASGRVAAVSVLLHMRQHPHCGAGSSQRGTTATVATAMRRRRLARRRANAATIVAAPLARPHCKMAGVALVTGASGAIGRAISVRLAATGWRVVMVARNDARARATREAVRAQLPAAAARLVEAETADLSLHGHVRALAERWKGPLHALVNNVAAAPRKREVTDEGIERQWATNVLSYLWMAEAFKPFLIEGAPSRIVNVASNWAGGIDLHDLQFERRPYSNTAAYRQSKAANRMLTVALAHRLARHRITVNACHPGVVDSKLSADLGSNGFESPKAGAATPVDLVLDASLADVTAAYFDHGRRVRCAFGDDSVAVEALYRMCEAMK
jgi:NAD(P)-dependent dehydrogenase (short-subunit alcohol dehydrogenase family)